VPSGWWR